MNSWIGRGLSGSKPHLRRHLQAVGPDPHFVEKVRDIVGFYINPPEAALVLCVDEKPQIQALDRTAINPAVAPGPARPRRRTTTSGVAPPTSTPPSTSPRGGSLCDMTERHRADRVPAIS